MLGSADFWEGTHFSNQFLESRNKERASFVLNVQMAEQEEKSEAFWNTSSPYCSGEGL